MRRARRGRKHTTSASSLRSDLLPPADAVRRTGRVGQAASSGRERPRTLITTSAGSDRPRISTRVSRERIRVKASEVDSHAETLGLVAPKRLATDRAQASPPQQPHGMSVGRETASGTARAPHASIVSPHLDVLSYSRGQRACRAPARLRQRRAPRRAGSGPTNQSARPDCKRSPITV